MLKINSINFKGNFDLCTSTKSNFSPDTKNMIQTIADSVNASTPEDCEGVIVVRDDKLDRNHITFSIYKTLPDGISSDSNYLDLIRSYSIFKHTDDVTYIKKIADCIGQNTKKELA